MVLSNPIKRSKIVVFHSAGAMKFVPGFRNDVFLSYSRVDDTEGWVSLFRERLETALQKRLGSDVSVWMDKRDLSSYVDFNREIRDQLDAAVFIAVGSPNYSKSQYCRKEREIYEELVAGKHRVKHGIKDLVNAEFRFKVIILIDEVRSDRQYWSNIIDVEFYEDKDGSSRTHRIASLAFEDKLFELETQVSGLLRKMRNQCSPVFLWPPPKCGSDVDQKREELANELAGASYRVLPELAVDYVREQEQAVLSIFLLGAFYHHEGEQLIDAAVAQGKVWAAWQSPAAEIKGESQQVQLLKKVASLNAKDVFDWKCDLKEEIMGLLQPSVSTSQDGHKNQNGTKQIVLLYTRLPDEERTASYVAFNLGDEFDVRQPSGKYSDDQRNLAAADGVLVLWASAEPEQYRICFDSMRNYARHARSKGVCLFRPPENKQHDLTILRGLPGLHVIVQFDAFDSSRLEPFLAPLRAGLGTSR
jgi:hypothetical protein